MKKRVFMYVVAAMVLGGSIFSSCSKKEESPAPVEKQQNNNNPGPNPNPNPNPGPGPSTDTTTLFTKGPWVTKKVYKDGAEQVGHFLINSGYKFNLPNTYIFSIPSFPSANGTWVFKTTGKNKVDLTNQAGTQTWNILSINATNMVIEEQGTDALWKYEFSH